MKRKIIVLYMLFILFLPISPEHIPISYCYSEEKGCGYSESEGSGKGLGSFETNPEQAN